jgi:hypothetical protein
VANGFFGGDEPLLSPPEVAEIATEVVEARGKIREKRIGARLGQCAVVANGLFGGGERLPRLRGRRCAPSAPATCPEA